MLNQPALTSDEAEMEQTSDQDTMMSKDGSIPQEPAGGSTGLQNTVQTGVVHNHTRSIEGVDKVNVNGGVLDNDDQSHTGSADNGGPDKTVTTEGVQTGHQCTDTADGHITHRGDQSGTTGSSLVPESDTRVQHHTDKMPSGGGGGSEEVHDSIKETCHKPTRHVTYSEGVDQLEWDKAMKLLQKNGDQVYRMVFKNEMHRLHRELETFNEEITRQYEKNARRIEKKKQALEEELNELEQRRTNARQLMEEESVKDAEVQQQQQDEDNSLQKKMLIDKEMKLLDREEKLTARQKQLEEYEAKIEKIEGYLDRRMDIARRRNTELIELDEAQRSFIQQKAIVETSAEDVPTDEPDNNQRQSITQPQAPVASENTQHELLQEKNTQLELVLKKTKADLAHSENSRQLLETKVSELEKAQEQSTKRIAELERHMFLNQTNLSSSLNHRMSQYPESTTDPSQDDLPSLADSTVLHTAAVPATAGHPASNVMKPVRFSVKIKPSRTPSLHSAPASPNTPTGHTLIERPALTWQQHEPRRQRRKNSITANTGPQTATHRRLSTHTSPLPVTQHRLSNAHTAPLHQHQHKLAPTPPLPAIQGNGAHGEVGHQQDGTFRDTWSDSELLHGEKVPPRSGMCVVQ